MTTHETIQSLIELADSWEEAALDDDWGFEQRHKPNMGPEFLVLTWNCHIEAKVYRECAEELRILIGKIQQSQGAKP